MYGVALSAGVALLGTPAYAQRGPGMRHEVRVRLREAMLGKLVAALGLDPATAARLREVVEKHSGGIEAAGESGQGWAFVTGHELTLLSGFTSNFTACCWCGPTGPVGH